MPNIKSAKKRVKVSSVKTAENKNEKTYLKTMLKNVDVAVAKNADNKEEAVRAAIKTVDQAAAKGLIHKNNASHKKAQLAAKLSK